ncbi:MAG: MBL fold metallo-hydrolase [Candidatus Thorarchaeota archaeon]
MTGLSEVVFLGTGVSSGYPLHYCKCEVCEEGRKDPSLERTRSSIALLGSETTLIDAGPDISFQLNRERISKVDRVFITHWHQDHIHGLGYLGEAVMLTGREPLDTYIPAGDIEYFRRQMHYIEQFINVHPVEPGEGVILEDASIEAVKTRHTEDSVGYIVDSTKKRFAYLLDTAYPSPETIERLKDIDLLIVEATLDFLENPYVLHMTMEESIRLWKELDVPECILTHFSCHGLRGPIGKYLLEPGLTHSERMKYESDYPGLRIAHDGMRLRFQ